MPIPIKPLETADPGEDDWYIDASEIGELYKVIGLVYRTLDAVMDQKPISALLPKMILELDAMMFAIDQDDVEWSKRADRFEEIGKLLSSDYYKYIYRRGERIVLKHEPLDKESESTKEAEGVSP